MTDKEEEVVVGEIEVRRSNPPLQHLIEIKYYSKRDRKEIKYDVLPAGARIQWFRDDYPDVQITTEVELREEDTALVTATVWKDNNTIWQQAHRLVSRAEFGGYVEKAETQAIARALKFLGYGATLAEDDGTGDEEGRPRTRHDDYQSEAQAEGRPAIEGPTDFWRELSTYGVEDRDPKVGVMLNQMEWSGKKSGPQYWTAAYHFVTKHLQEGQFKPVTVDQKTGEVVDTARDSATVIKHLFAGAAMRLAEAGGKKEPASKAQYGLVTGLLNQIFSDFGEDICRERRHAVLRNVYGVSSSKDLNRAQADTLLEWLQGEDGNPSVIATKEAAAIAGMPLEGQDPLPGTEEDKDDIPF